MRYLAIAAIDGNYDNNEAESHAFAKSFTPGVVQLIVVKKQDSRFMISMSKPLILVF
ncbi:hypothetical protein M7I_4786 [Glarea lozoyensis 74030]|uniref:Uncharacterized protein n=1 Tax=Glarea lozoyensis (strain ATCC 74030 / MF5533) TaxID=1104152 RepID=H0EQ43_GLAL7|nr:hypothetical protein M7I_4786 [Glarea lozoyensis 74030]